MEAALSNQESRPPLTRGELTSVFFDAFKPSELFLVGTEAEKPGLLTDTGAPIPYEGPRSVSVILEMLSQRYGWFPDREVDNGPVIALRRGDASITLEPGGQLELSGAPFTSIHDTAFELDQHMAELNDISRELGVVWLGLGFQPFAKQSDLSWVPKLRYGIMREYLPTRGNMALDMMRRTCTVQANLDYSSEDDAIDQMRIGLALAPIVTGMFANSPLVEGVITGERSHRARVWLNTDPDRSGLLPFVFDEDMSFERYTEWALDVPMFMVKRHGRVVHNTGQTFRSFMREGFNGVTATMDDWQTHLGTLFPEVRLKRTIEMRGADALPRELVCALPALWKGLLYDDEARKRVRSLASQVSPAEAEAVRPAIANLGLNAPFKGKLVLDWARDVLTIASDGLERLAILDKEGRDERVHLEVLAALLAQGQSPADALLAKLDHSAPLFPQLVQLVSL
jgi:glutamate--cysteine ligase